MEPKRQSVRLADLIRMTETASEPEGSLRKARLGATTGRSAAAAGLAESALPKASIDQLLGTLTGGRSPGAAQALEALKDAVPKSPTVPMLPLRPDYVLEELRSLVRVTSDQNRMLAGALSDERSRRRTDRVLAIAALVIAALTLAAALIMPALLAP